MRCRRKRVVEEDSEGLPAEVPAVARCERCGKRFEGAGEVGPCCATWADLPQDRWLDPEGE